MALLVDPPTWIEGGSIIFPATSLLLAVVSTYSVVFGRGDVVRDRIIRSSMTKMQRDLGTLRNEVTQDLRVAHSCHADPQSPHTCSRLKNSTLTLPTDNQCYLSET